MCAVHHLAAEPHQLPRVLQVVLLCVSMASVGCLPKVVAICFGMDSMLKNKQECHEFTKVFFCLAEMAGVSARKLCLPAAG